MKKYRILIAAILIFSLTVPLWVYAEEEQPENQEVSREDILLQDILDCLENDVYSQTLAALQNGEIIAYGDESRTAAGFQQTLVDLGYEIDVDGEIGPQSSNTFHDAQSAYGLANTDIVDTAAYEQLLVMLLIHQDDDAPREIVADYYAEDDADHMKYLAYLEGCVAYAQEKYFTAKECFEESAYGNYEERAASCVQEWPADGELWRSSSLPEDDMKLIFDVNSEDDAEGMYFEVYTQEGMLAASLFLTGSGSVTTSLPGGIYRIRNAAGREWYGMKETFGREGRYEYMTFFEGLGDDYLTDLASGYAWTISVNVDTDTAEGDDVGSVSSDWDSWTN